MRPQLSDSYFHPSTPSAQQGMSVTQQQEFYIRQPSETEAQGPFTRSQLDGLVTSGGVNERTLYFNAENEEWAAIHEILGGEFTASKRFPATRESAINGATMTDDMPASPAPRPRTIVRSAMVLLAAGVALLLVIPALAGGIESLPANPFAWLGVLDVVLLALVGIGGVDAAGKMCFALAVRMRAALGFGFLGIIFWLQDRPGALVAALVFSVCLWASTVLPKAGAALINVISGLAAAGILAYCLLM